MVTVLDTLHVRYVIGLGEGAGANVIARFGLAHPTRTLGLILINCTGSAVSVKENFKAKVNEFFSFYHYLNISFLVKLECFCYELFSFKILVYELETTIIS